MQQINNCNHEIVTETIDLDNEVTFCVRCDETFSTRHFVSDEETAIFGEY